MAELSSSIGALRAGGAAAGRGAPRQRPATRTSEATTLGDVAISGVVCSVVMMALLFANPRVQHWFVIPVFACGVIIGTDAVRWFRGRLDPLEPVGVIGLLGFHFFFLAPLLHVHWDYWLRYVEPPDDWRGWLGRMAFLNLAGLLIYVAARVAFTRRRAGRSPTHVVSIDPRRLYPILVPALVVTAALQLVVFARSGGVTGLVNPTQETIENFQGWGIVFLVSEAFPILAILGYAVWARSRGGMPSWWAIAGVLLAFTVAKFLFGGLRGSRSNTVWGMMWAVGILHLWVRPFPRQIFVAGVSILVVFMYLYGFYKSYGTEAVSIVQSAELREERADQSGRTVQATILGDLGRADMQAFLLHRLTDPTVNDDGFDYGWGRTYVGAAALVIPSWLWPGRPATKGLEGTDALYGDGSYANGRRASRVYGMTGEAMLNVTPALAPIIFVVFGWAVAAVTWRFHRLSEDDARRLMLPFLVTVIIILLTADSDNLIFFLIKNGAVPFAIIMLASTRRPVPRPATSGPPALAAG